MPRMWREEQLAGLLGEPAAKASATQSREGDPRSLVERCWLSPVSLALGRIQEGLFLQGKGYSLRVTSPSQSAWPERARHCLGEGRI